MKTSDFFYDLPADLIAHTPAPERSHSRLMVLPRNGTIRHMRFFDLPEILRAGDVLVFNQSRVIPARLFARKATGGRVEILIERILDSDRAIAHVRGGKTGLVVTLESGDPVAIEGRDGDLFHLALQASAGWHALLEAIGHMPLPPYITRADLPEDRARYQTVYARDSGSVAAPTAGLHFDEPLLAQLSEAGVHHAFVTLHVGAGTFQPVRTGEIGEHRMHQEWIDVPESACSTILQARQAGGRVIAVGTTSVRALETAWGAHGGALRPFQGETDIFITPGHAFGVIDGLITNFHLPESTLLMLVSAFAGLAPVRRAYQEAIAEKYRFFSYGDAMFLERNDCGDG